MTDKNIPGFNLAAMWRDWVVKSEQQWSENLSQLLKDERTGAMIGRQVDEARMMHKMFTEMSQAALAAANLPSRLDLEWLDERMGKLEDGLSAVQAEVSQLRNALVEKGAADAAAAGGARRPPRTRKAPAKAPSRQ